MYQQQAPGFGSTEKTSTLSDWFDSSFREYRYLPTTLLVSTEMNLSHIERSADLNMSVNANPFF